MFSPDSRRLAYVCKLGGKSVVIVDGAEVNVRTKTLEYKTDRFGLEGVLTILPRGLSTRVSRGRMI